MQLLNVDHKLATQLIYASAILHNYCDMFGRDADHLWVHERARHAIMCTDAVLECAWALKPSNYVADQKIYLESMNNVL